MCVWTLLTFSYWPALILLVLYISILSLFYDHLALVHHSFYYSFPTSFITWIVQKSLTHVWLRIKRFTFSRTFIFFHCHCIILCYMRLKKHTYTHSIAISSDYTRKVSTWRPYQEILSTRIIFYFLYACTD